LEGGLDAAGDARGVEPVPPVEVVGRGGLAIIRDRDDVITGPFGHAQHDPAQFVGESADLVMVLDDDRMSVSVHDVCDRCMVDRHRRDVDHGGRHGGRDAVRGEPPDRVEHDRHRGAHGKDDDVLAFSDDIGNSELEPVLVRMNLRLWLPA
jgi:hypothetical protein